MHKSHKARRENAAPFVTLCFCGYLSEPHGCNSTIAFRLSLPHPTTAPRRRRYRPDHHVVHHLPVAEPLQKSHQSSVHLTLLERKPNAAATIDREKERIIKAPLQIPERVLSRMLQSIKNRR